ncbi:MAG: hypothetical protein WKG01_29530 [Kofleriaceae bacterium]
MYRLIAVCALAAGCLPAPHGPRSGAVPTGDRVAVVDDVKTWTTTYEEKVGSTDYKNADGEVVASSDRYATRQQRHAKKIWYPVQGPSQITDEDFFRITGDQLSLERSEALRAKGRRYAALGTGSMLVGIASMIAARFVTGNQGLMIGLYSGGGIVGLAGGYGFMRGREMQSPDNHAVDRSTAELDARRYNGSLGRPALGIGGRF